MAGSLSNRVRREAVGGLLDDQSRALLAKIKAFPGVEALGPMSASESPVVPIIFTRHEQRWSYFSLVTTVGTPRTLTAQELRVECMFPLET